MSIPARIARQLAGYTRADAAKRARISAKYLGQLERGEYPCTFDVFERLSRLYGVQVSFPIRQPNRGGGATTESTSGRARPRANAGRAPAARCGR